MKNLLTTSNLRELDDLFDRYLNLRRPFLYNMRTEGDKNELTLPDWNPSVDITETEHAYKVKAELPGVQKSDVSVTLENGVLTIRGEKKYEKETKEETVHRVENTYGSFVRSFSLPKEVDANKVSAAYKDGILTLTAPKLEASQEKSVEIEVI